MKATFHIKKNSAFITGLCLLLLPFVFWIAVFNEVILRDNFLMENFVVQLDRASSLLSITILFVFPAIAFFINLAKIFHWKLSFVQDEIINILSVKLQWWHLFICIISFISISMVLGYSFTENFQIVAR